MCVVLSVDDEPDTDTEPCFIFCFELVRSLFATMEKLDSRRGTGGCLRSIAEGGFDRGTSVVALFWLMTRVPKLDDGSRDDGTEEARTGLAEISTEQASASLQDLSCCDTTSIADAE